MDVIYLNGASGSGKTMLATELQEQLEGYYLHIGIDTLIDMMPAKSNDWHKNEAKDGFSWRELVLPNGEKGMRITLGEYGRQINETYREIVLTLLKSGNKVIIDDIANGNDEVDIWRQRLAGYLCCFVGVHCRLETLKYRESLRENRKNGSSAEQYFRVHNGIKYDFEVNTDELSPNEAASEIVNFLKI